MYAFYDLKVSATIFDIVLFMAVLIALPNKVEAIKNEVGDDFICLDDSVTDLPIWQYCK
mgnify:CR=1 FL=1